mgnify:CR=1 FL=1
MCRMRKKCGKLFLDDINFPFQDYIETVFNTFNYSRRKIKNFNACSLIIINQNQGLMLPGASIAYYFAFPSTGFNQPACGKFYLVIPYRITDNVWKSRLLVFKFFNRNNRVFKKTTRIAYCRWIRKFIDPNM